MLLLCFSPNFSIVREKFSGSERARAQVSKWGLQEQGSSSCHAVFSPEISPSQASCAPLEPSEIPQIHPCRRGKETANLGHTSSVCANFKIRVWPVSIRKIGIDPTRGDSPVVCTDGRGTASCWKGKHHCLPRYPCTAFHVHSVSSFFIFVSLCVFILPDGGHGVLVGTRHRAPLFVTMFTVRELWNFFPLPVPELHFHIS